MTIKVMVVDDSVVYRRVVRTVLDGIEAVEVVGVARDGQDALDKLPILKPDLITLDVEMPHLDGLQTLLEIQKQNLTIDVVMVSALGRDGAEITIKALEAGAHDFITKPASKDFEENVNSLRGQLTRIIAGLLLDKGLSIDSTPSTKSNPHSASLNTEPKTLPGPFDVNQHSIADSSSRSTDNGDKLDVNANKVSTRSGTAGLPRGRARASRIDVLAIGISTGGPNALAEFLPQLPSDLGVPVFIVQHMPANFTTVLSQSLDKKCAMPVVEVTESQPVCANTIYLAAGGRHLKIETRDDEKIAVVTDDEPIQHCRPSVNYLFDSVARVYGAHTLGLIMTGMGSDGTNGARTIRAARGVVIAQDAQSCVVNGMPQSVVDAGLVDQRYPLSELSRVVKSYVRTLSPR